ncbi:hypothetical protein Ahy_A06g026001 [Arachis hypogaea]|uniref:DUF4187 domain-containing protein n=1 Tax=Arachis hypogaea TaxID=3818 RepID=A0A445CJ47_ARAHY|nr:hypothetical protein Ahy_A06g026001 [Arachis hypogaea]
MVALDQLDNREIIEPEKNEDDEEEEEITEEDLQEVLMKLRDDHNYCLFCRCKVSKQLTHNTKNQTLTLLKLIIIYKLNFDFYMFRQYESKDALLTNCPGTNEDNH